MHQVDAALIADQWTGGKKKMQIKLKTVQSEVGKNKDDQRIKE